MHVYVSVLGSLCVCVCAVFVCEREGEKEMFAVISRPLRFDPITRQ